MALAADTAGVVNVADCMAALLLQRVLGMGASVKYGTGQGKLAQAALAAGGNAAVSGICGVANIQFLIDILSQQFVRPTLMRACSVPWSSPRLPLLERLLEPWLLP